MRCNQRTIWSLILVLGLTMGMLAAGVNPTVQAAGDRPGEGVTVTSGKAGWTSGEPKSALYEVLLSELGYDVEPATLFNSNPIAYLSIYQGDIDFWPSGWYPLHLDQLPDGFDERGTVAGTACPGCGVDGYLVDIPSIEEFGITSIDDFTRPEVKAAFDETGDGKADLFGCPAGWGCYELIEHHLDAYDLRDHVNHISAEYAATFANALARMQAGESVLYYTWAPNDTILLAQPGEDVQWIGVPFAAPVPAQESLPEEAFVAEGLEGAVSDPLLLGFVPSDIHVVANKEFLADNPAAAKLFEVVEIPLMWISEASLRINEGEDSHAEILALANEWIEANRDQVDEWLAVARQAAN